MKRELSQKNQEKHDEKDCAGNYFLSQKEQACPSAAAREPADGQAVNFLPDEKNYNPDRSKSMAESVTRHTLISSVDKIEYLTCGIDSLDVGLYVSW